MGTGTAARILRAERAATEDGATGFLSRLFGRGSDDAEESGGAATAEDRVPESGGRDDSLPAASAPETDGPTVVAYLRLSDPEFTNEREQMRLFSLEDRIMSAVSAAGGTYEGNYVDRGFFRLYASGTDAEQLAAVIMPLLGDAPPGSILVKRNGPPGTDEERLPL